MACTPELVKDIEDLGIEVMVRDLVDEKRPTWHDKEKLTQAFEEVLEACHSRVR